MTSPRPFRARFAGWCAVCHEKIEEGQWVIYDDEGNVVHAGHDEDDDGN